MLSIAEILTADEILESTVLLAQLKGKQNEKSIELFFVYFIFLLLFVSGNQADLKEAIKVGEIELKKWIISKY